MNSWNRAVIAIAICLVVGEQVRGDMFPGRLETNNVQVRVRLDFVENYPEYDFYLQYARYRVSPGPVNHLVQVTPGTVHLLPGEGRIMSEVVLACVPRGQKPSVPNLAYYPPLYVETIPGEIRSAPLPGIASTWSVNGEVSGYVLPYRVVIHDGVMEVTPGAPEFVSYSDWLDSHPITAGFSLAGFWLAVAITLGGLGFARWCWRAKR